MYEPVIGLEVHIQLKTESKLFCSCSSKFGSSCNTQICPVCLGLPGSLPVLNKRAVSLAIISALALNCKINNLSSFYRKNYFYPDLPKAYQISQYDEPIAIGGFIEIDEKKIRIIRVHLEEDAGKLTHKGEYSLVDYNRCGIPLIEVVSGPDITSPKEAYKYLTQLKTIFEYIKTSDCNMEEGSLRCDANVSLKKDDGKMGVKVEIKNMNSFKGVEKALSYEIERQSELLKNKESIVQETRLWDEDKGKTFSMRKKEEAYDYRYFPEPDLPLLEIDDNWIKELKREIPELPASKRKRFIRQYGLPAYDVDVLTSSKEIADFFEETIKGYNNPKIVSNWIMTEILSIEKAETIENLKIKPYHLAKMLKMIEMQEISGKIGKDLIVEMAKGGKDPSEIVKEKGLVQIKDEETIILAIKEVILENKKAVMEYKSGKEKVFSFLIGALMKKTQGKANPQVSNQLLKEELSRL